MVVIKNDDGTVDIQLDEQQAKALKEALALVEEEKMDHPGKIVFLNDLFDQLDDATR